MSTSTSTITDRERVDPPTCDLTADDMFESLTGFDEIAVRRTFDTPVATLAQVDSLQFVRALVFVHERRTGSTDGDALKRAQSLTLAQVSDYFADEVDEVDPDDPTSDQGKDDETTESGPAS